MISVRQPVLSFAFILSVMSFSLLSVLTLSPPGAAAGNERKSLNLVREVRPLTGGLNETPVFNSNSPELVTSDGILLSTFSRQFGSAHLDYTFDGDFDVFFHHIASSAKRRRKEDLYLGLVVGNEGLKPATVEVLNAASYLTRPDAPFISLPAISENELGYKYAGPGDRVTSFLLRGNTHNWKNSLLLNPGEQVLLQKFNIPVSKLKPQLNGRTCIAQLRSNGSVRLALVACFAYPRNRFTRYLSTLSLLSLIVPRSKYRAPFEQEFIDTLNKGRLVEPREQPPSPPGELENIRYGRVSGVSIGSIWKATLTDESQSNLMLPQPEKPVSFVLSSLMGGTFGTGQIQSAPLTVRNKDTAFQAHGNYGVKYDLLFPLKNDSNRRLNLYMSLESPIKSNVKSESVKFLVPPARFTCFRGTIKVSLDSKDGTSRVKYRHIVQRRGEMGKPFFAVPFQPGQEQSVRLEFFYPPDCTPPHLLTLSTLHE